jgi:hypothetical protein
MILGSGWSGPENWGVWGIGPVHELELSQRAGEGLAVDVDVHAFLPEAYCTQLVEAVVGDEVVATWRFASEANRRICSLQLPPSTAGASDELTSVTVKLRLRELHPSLAGERPLGIALHRIRVIRRS